jgi:hypothetical protein
MLRKSIDRQAASADQRLHQPGAESIHKSLLPDSVEWARPARGDFLKTGICFRIHFASHEILASDSVQVRVLGIVQRLLRAHDSRI